MGLIEIGTALWVREQERQLEREKKKFREDDEENGLLYFPRLIYSGGGGNAAVSCCSFLTITFHEKIHWGKFLRVVSVFSCPVVHLSYHGRHLRIRFLLC